MPATFTTLNIKDGGGTLRTVRVIDESGVGDGPFSFGTILVDGGGTKQVAKEEDAAHTTADPLIPAGAVRRDTPAVGSGTDGDYSTFNVDGTGWLRVTFGTGTKSAIFLEDAAHSSGDGSVFVSAVRRDSPSSGVSDDGDYASFNVSSVGRLYVDVAGNVAHDDSDTGHPIKIGAKARGTLAGLTLPASGDRVDLSADLDGALVVRPHGTLVDYLSGNASNTDGASTAVISAQGSGIRTYLTDVTLTNTSASNIHVEIKDGTTVMWTFPVPANGGVTHHFGTPLVGTANTAWNFDASSGVTTLYCSAAGFKSKVG